MVELQWARLVLIADILEGQLGVGFVAVVELAPLEELVLTDDVSPLRADPGAGGEQGLQGQAGEHYLQHLGRQV